MQQSHDSLHAYAYLSHSTGLGYGLVPAGIRRRSRSIDLDTSRRNNSEAMKEMALRLRTQRRSGSYDWFLAQDLVLPSQGYPR
jgi:hypothetical protein